MMHPNNHPNNGMMVVPSHMVPSLPNVASSNNLSDTTSSVRQNKSEMKSKKGPSKSPRGRSSSITASMNESVTSDGGGDDDDDDDDDDDGGGNGDVSSRLTRNQREQKRYVDLSSYPSHDLIRSKPHAYACVGQLEMMVIILRISFLHYDCHCDCLVDIGH